MKALLACALALFAATLAAGVEPGRACSCALPDPRAALVQADGAFVGRLVSRRDGERQDTLVFSVDRALKGTIAGAVEVSTASNSAACGLELSVGTRVGLVLERRDGAWHGHLCLQFEPEELLAAALPLPPPNGRGPAALVVGGAFGEVRLIALDAHGRTLAYGRGGGRVGLVSICPGKERLAELAYTGTGTTLATRNTRTLRILGRRKVSLPGQRYAQRLRCEDRLGARVVVFARGPSGGAGGSALYRMSSGRATEMWKGAAIDAEITARRAYLSAGKAGRSLLRVDLVGRRRVSRLAVLPDPATGFSLNRAGTALAGVIASGGTSVQVVRVGVGQQPANVTSAPFSARAGQAQVFWLPTGRLLFVPSYGEKARVLDASLRTRSRFGWTAVTAALVGSELFGTDLSARLFRSALPEGPQRIARRLPGRPTLLVAITP